MNKLKAFFKLLGPGFITGASDDDPSGIGTYSQTGAQFGYSQLWLALFCLPFMSVIQEMCGRIGMVSGKGLACLIKKHYPGWLLYTVVAVLCVANTINIGADLDAMAASVKLLTGIHYHMGLFVLTIFTVLLQIFVPYKQYATYLKYMALTLLAYMAAAFSLRLDWGEILHATILPSFSLSQDYLINIVAVLGTTISPYLFFWQASEEVETLVEENRLQDMNTGEPDTDQQEISEIKEDTFIGMAFSQLIMFFIIVTTAAALHQHGITRIETAVQAAQALKPIAGPYAALLFTLGIVGTGLLSVPVLAGSASYAVSATLGWKLGLYRRFNEAKGFYCVIAAATVIGLLINFIHIPPFQMLYYTAVLNGLCAPPLMIIIILIGNNRNIMGQYANTRFSSIAAWIITGLMAVAAVALLLTFLKK